MIIYNIELIIYSNIQIKEIMEVIVNFFGEKINFSLPNNYPLLTHQISEILNVQYKELITKFNISYYDDKKELIHIMDDDQYKIFLNFVLKMNKKIELIIDLNEKSKKDKLNFDFVQYILENLPYSKSIYPNENK